MSEIQALIDAAALPAMGSYTDLGPAAGTADDAVCARLVVDAFRRAQIAVVYVIDQTFREEILAGTVTEVAALQARLPEALRGELLIRLGQLFTTAGA